MLDRLPAALVARLRKEVHSLLSTLSPAEAQALRAQFRLDAADDQNADEESLLALAKELARLTRLKKKS